MCGPPWGPGKPLVTVCRSAAIDVSHCERVLSTLEVRLWVTISTTPTAISRYTAATMPVAASATRWAPERTRSTRAILNVLSPVPSFAAYSFRIDDTIQVRGRDDPGPFSCQAALGNGRHLARVLLRLARGTLAGLVRGGLIRHERA